MKRRLTGLSSMATRQLMRALSEECMRSRGTALHFESAGGIEVARRVRSGESFDLVVLAADAIEALAAADLVVRQTCRPIAESAIAAAVPAHAALPDLSSEQAVRAALLSARRIGLSTGPSGSALLDLLAGWGVLDALRGRLVQAPAGTPVATLLAGGHADLGFQQFSELKNEPGIAIAGPLPAGLVPVTTFCGAVTPGSRQPAVALAALNFMGSAATDAIKRLHGMAPAEASSASFHPPVREKLQ